MYSILYIPRLNDKTGLFKILEPLNQEIGAFYVVQERFTTYFEVHML